MRYPTNRAAIFDLIGEKENIGIFTPKIGLVANQLEVDSKNFINQMINKHSLLPYYAPFLKEDRQKVINDFVARHIPKGRTNTGWSSSIRKLHNKYMRYCHICTTEDRGLFGESYWHRFHQIFGVDVCLRHRVFLQDSNVLLRNCSVALITSESAIKELFPNRRNFIPDERLFLIAEDIDWILAQKGKIRIRETALTKYRCLCINLGLANWSGHISIEQIIFNILQRHPRELLEMLKCGIDNNQQLAWPTQLFFKSQDYTNNPLHHILFLQSLGLRLRDIIDLPMTV
jgi:hypothetical protein